MFRYKLITIILIIFFFLFTPLYLLFFSPSLANYTILIKARTWYFDTARRTYENLFPNNNIDVYTFTRTPFRVYSKTVTNGYYYGFTGKYEKIDYDNSVIYFKSSNGKEYGFKFKLNSTKDFENRNQNLVVDGVDKMGNPVTYSFNSLTGNDDFLIIWFDGRKLTELLSLYKKQPKQSVNLYDNNIMYIMNLKK